MQIFWISGANSVQGEGGVREKGGGGEKEKHFCWLINLIKIDYDYCAVLQQSNEIRKTQWLRGIFSYYFFLPEFDPLDLCSDI